MKIENILIDGFKNISNVKLKLGNITALVAINNFGKSNVLHGINFGLTFIKANNEEKADMMSNSILFPINSNIQGKNYKFEVEAITQENRIVQYGYEFRWYYNSKREPEIIKEYLKIKLNKKNNKFTQFINRTEEKALYKSSESGRCSSKIKIKSNELIINKLHAYDNLYYSDIINKINNMRMYMENNFDTENFCRPDPIIRKGFENEMIDTVNLPRIIFQLKQKEKNKFKLLKDIYFQLFPDIEDIIVKEYTLNQSASNKIPDDAPFIVTDKVYFLYVKNRNLIKTVDFSTMSDGAKRIFMILTKIIISRNSNVSLIAIEEPENSVHPGLFHAYIQIINQLLDNCKIILTSHSPYIVNYLNPLFTYIGINKIPGVAQFFTFKKSGKNQLEKDACTFNMSTGDYLFSMLTDVDSYIEDYLEGINGE